MFNPLHKDVVLANGVALSTGAYSYTQGQSGLDSVNIGLWWRWWYKNMTMSVALFGIVFAYAYTTGEWGYLVAQAVVNTLVAGITYSKLVAVSSFKQRLAFRVWWPVARRFPYTARFWFYLCLFLPVWTAMWFHNHHLTGARLEWFS